MPIAGEKRFLGVHAQAVGLRGAVSHPSLRHSGEGARWWWLSCPLAIDGSSTQRREIAIADLDLDCENPRHGLVADQDEALARLVADQKDRIVRLAVDIDEVGFSPAQLFVVMPGRSGRYTVLDGNRRLAALRILNEPTWLPEPLRSPAFTKAVSEPGFRPNSVLCAVVPNRDEARTWLDRMHSGQLAGVGNVPWSAAAKYRFNQSSRGHTASAIAVLDWLRQRLEVEDPARS